MIYDKGARTITWENVLEKLDIHMQQNDLKSPEIPTYENVP